MVACLTVLWGATHSKHRRQMSAHPRISRDGRPAVPPRRRQRFGQRERNHPLGSSSSGLSLTDRLSKVFLEGRNRGIPSPVLSYVELRLSGG